MSLQDDLQRAIEAHIKEVGKEITDRAVERFRTSVEEEMGRVTVRLLKQVSMEKLAHELLIHVKVDTEGRR